MSGYSTVPNESEMIPWRNRKILRDVDGHFNEKGMLTDDDAMSPGMGLEQTSLSPERRGSQSLHGRYLLSHVDHIKMAVKIAPLWFVSNYFYNLSLAYTTITSSTVLSSTGSVFTFIFSLTCGDERFTRWKLLGVMMAFGGSVLTSLHDASNAMGDDGTDALYKYQLWGDAAGLVSAVGYGGYTVLVRVLCPADENRMSMQLFLGYIGLINMVLLSPFLMRTLATMNDAGDQGANQDQNQDQANPDSDGVQQLTMVIFLCLVVKGLFDNVLSDYLWARSIILTSATVATVGLGLTIPLALLSDFFIMQRDDIFSFGSIIGAIFVLTGFIFVNIGEGTGSDESIAGASDTSRSQELDESDHIIL